MKKAVVYASTTGNTEAMANAVIEGAKESGAEVYSATADSAAKPHAEPASARGDYSDSAESDYRQ